MQVSYREENGMYLFYGEYREEDIKVRGLWDIVPVLNHYGLKGWEFICWDSGKMIFKRVIKNQTKVVLTVNGKEVDEIKGIELIKEEPIFKDLIEKGVEVIEYKEGKICYEVDGSRVKLEKSIYEIDVYRLALKLAVLNGEELNGKNPNLIIKGKGLRIVVNVGKVSGGIIFYIVFG